MKYNYKYNVKVCLILIFIICGFLFSNIAIAQNSKIDFVKTDIWYSKTDLTEGDKVKIYTAIYNPDNRELSGTIAFYDNSVLLGKKNFIIPGNGVRDVSIDWVVTLGGHSIFAKIEEAKLTLAKGKYEQVSLNNVETKKDINVIYKKVVPEINTEGESKKTESPVAEPISDIGLKIIEKTPEFISEPVSDSVNFLENFRVENKTLTNIKKEQAKQDVEFSKDTKSSPFAYAKLFLFTLLSYVFSSKLLFYGLFIFIFAGLIGLIWRRFF